MKYSLELHATCAPTPVHVSEIVSVICDELHAALFLGFGTKTAVFTETSGTYADRLDFQREENGLPNESYDIDSPPVYDAITKFAIASVKDWAKDIGAFYNNDLLEKTVNELCNDWWVAGLQATNLEPAIESLTAYIDRAHTANNLIERS
jgi:hypothetical protein